MRSRMLLLSTLSALLVFVIVASACGLGDDGATTGAGDGTKGGNQSNPTVTPIPTDPEHLVALNLPGDATVPAPGSTHPLLHVRLNGSDSEFDDYPFAGIICGAELAWATSHPDQATYSAKQFQDLQVYLHTVPFDRFANPMAGENSSGAPIPSTLRWVNGAYAQQPECLANLQVTNASAAPIVISQVGVHYLAAPLANAYQYAEIDACTIDPARYCLGGKGGETGICAYIAQVQLDATGGVGAEMAGDINPNHDGCPSAVSLAPGQPVAIHLIIEPPSGAPALIYQIVPTLTVTDTTQHGVVVSSLRNTLVFSDAGQFACYGESNGQVVPESAIHYPLRDTQGNTYPGPVCI
ncbi:MAG TPA: hypothetical protein VF120_16550 [Ktedonobacterales bacterium]